MCVIIASNKRKAPIDWLEKAVEKNKDGNGLAWVENGKVRFVKSMTLEPIKAIYERIEPPYVFHARIATQGGTNLKLCHPFPITQGVPLVSEGTAPAVFFHNGNHNSWEDMCRDAVLRWRLKWPDGPWSDSRAMAWLCFHFGTNFADLLDQKIAILNHKRVRIYGTGWEHDEGIHMSNKYFLNEFKSCGYDRGYSHDSEFYRTHHWDTAQMKYVPNEVCPNEACVNGQEYNVQTGLYEPCAWCNPQENRLLLD